MYRLGFVVGSCIDARARRMQQLGSVDLTTVAGQDEGGFTVARRHIHTRAEAE